MKNQTVRMMTPGQMKEIISAMVEGVPASMAFETARDWIGNKGRLTSQVRKIFSIANPYAELLADWQNFYRVIFGIEVNFSILRIPEKQPGFDRLIVMAQGITPQRAHDKCAELFPCRKLTDKILDKVIDFSFQTRSAQFGAYAIWFRDRSEADEELKNFSANDLKKKNIPGITLEERFIYELKFFNETGKHLDSKNITLCAGSRCSDGDVPDVHWCAGGGLGVSWYYPDGAYPYLRSRQVVS